MTKDRVTAASLDAWARFSFSIIGTLLAAPPAKGELRVAIEKLAAQVWTHPITEGPMTVAFSTIERWFYKARDHHDPLSQLRRAVRKDAGRRLAMAGAMRELLRAQHKEHPGWAYQLHAENLAALCRRDKDLGPAPSYSTVLRYMKCSGLYRRAKRKGKRGEAGDVNSEFADREVRSFESSFVNQLWHLDFHQGSKKVLVNRTWVTPILLCILDDHSRLVCHAQWYLHENTESLVHGYCQAVMKRGLPREQLNDNGGPMTSAEFVGGLERLSIIPRCTMSYSPYQNGKQENWFARVESRLIPMLESEGDLSLRRLNEATMAWVDFGYDRRVHSEIASTPLDRFLHGESVARESPGSEVLRSHFRRDVKRVIRRSDGTLTIDGTRFEVDENLRHLGQVGVRYAHWDFTYVHLVDGRTGDAVSQIYPLDKRKNADGRRRIRAQPGTQGPNPSVFCLR